MRVNPTFVRWIYDDYDTEANFYMKNNYRLLLNDFMLKSVIYGIVVFLLAMAMAVFGADNDGVDMITPNHAAMMIADSLYMGYILYVAEKFGCNGLNVVWKPIGAIVFTFWTLLRVWTTPAAKIMFVFIFPLWVVSTIVLPAWYILTSGSFKKEAEERFEQEEARRKEQYEQWKSRFAQTNRYASYVESDKMKEARKLFEGFTADAKALKTKYKQLVKLHHPDQGGDTEFFQCILDVYNEWQEKLGKA